METNLIGALTAFGIGAALEAYTYSLTKDHRRSYGIGWGLFLAYEILHMK
jgi:hypothetical protein